LIQNVFGLLFMRERGWHKVILAVILMVAVGVSLWFSTPARALIVDITDPLPTIIARPVTFDVTVTVEAAELLPIQSIDLEIYKSADPSYKATCTNLPLSSVTGFYYSNAVTGGGDVYIDANASWVYGYGYGYAVWEGTPYSFGYGYGYGPGPTGITYSVTWNSPSWPVGEYTAKTIITANGTTFSKTKTFTLSQPPGGGVGSRDTTKPRLSDIWPCEITKTTADICWKTHEKSDSQVRYRSSPDMLSELDEEMVIEHRVHLTGLTPATTYYYITMSRDRSDNLAESDEYTFTTLGDPAAFDIRSLDITPAEVEIGEEVTISAMVYNTGDGPGSYELTLKVDDAAVDTEEVSLYGGTSQKVTFTVSRDVAETYSVSIDGLSGSFVVKPAPPEEPEEPVQEPEEPVQEPEEPVESKPINWWLIGGIIAAIIAVTTVVWLAVIRQRA
jgi:hypothetical protein